MDRRTLLKRATGIIGLAAAGMIGLPALLSGFAPFWARRPRGSLWQAIGSVDEFPLGEMRKVIVAWPNGRPENDLRHRAVYAWRPSVFSAIVYSRNCTDLGCPLTYDPGSQCFYCPCHGGIFDKNGNRMAGPPSRPMYRYTTRFRNGQIQIDLNSVPPMA